MKVEAEKLISNHPDTKIFYTPIKVKNRILQLSTLFDGSKLAWHHLCLILAPWYFFANSFFEKIKAFVGAPSPLGITHVKKYLNKKFQIATNLLSLTSTYNHILVI